VVAADEQIGDMLGPIGSSAAASVFVVLVSRTVVMNVRQRRYLAAVGGILVGPVAVLWLFISFAYRNPLRSVCFGSEILSGLCFISLLGVTAAYLIAER
jgi:hypothetical protein